MLLEHTKLVKVMMPLRQIPPNINIKDNAFNLERAEKMFPAIVKKMLDYMKTQKQFSNEIIENIETFLSTIPYQQVPDHSEQQEFEDTQYWQDYLKDLKGKTWLDVDFLFAETYIYREINIITQNLVPIGKKTQNQTREIDPFYDQKEAALQILPQQIIQQILKRQDLYIKEELKSVNLKTLILGSISGNQADLSKWPELNSKLRGKSNDQSQTNFAVNDLPKVLTYLIGLDRKATINFGYFLDNVGIELLSDLCLIDYLLTIFQQANIIAYIKPVPLFVSDVTQNDLDFTLEFLIKYSTEFVERLNNYQKEKRLIIKQHHFLTTPLPLWQAPNEILNDIASTQLTFFKGVFNYLKIIGSKYWDKSTPFKDIVAYFNTNIVALNIAKAPIAVGLDLEYIKKLIPEGGDEWLCCGKWAFLQTNI